MNRITLLALFVLSLQPVLSQTAEPAPFLKTKKLPDFTLTNIDFKEINQNSLQKNRSTIIMLFNPECDHCQQQLELFLATPQVVKNAQVVLSSLEPQEKNKEFYTRYHLEKYPFIYLGREYGNFFGTYYQPSTIPFIAIYNPRKQLVLYNHGSVTKAQLITALNARAVPVK